MLRIAVCDDNQVVCSKIEEIIVMRCRSRRIEACVDVFYSGESLIQYLSNSERYDAIFLDIELVNMNGVAVGAYIRNQLDDYTTKIIYISSKSGYDRQLFDVHPLHFLEKPIAEERIVKDIDLVIKLTNNEKQWFEFQIKKDIHKILIKDILYFESVKRKIILLTNKERYEFYGTLEQIEKKVESPQFFKPHRSYFVNYDAVSIVKKDVIVMVNNSIIPISRLKAKAVRQYQLSLFTSLEEK